MCVFNGNGRFRTLIRNQANANTHVTANSQTTRFDTTQDVCSGKERSLSAHHCKWWQVIISSFSLPRIQTILSTAYDGLKPRASLRGDLSSKPVCLAKKYEDKRWHRMQVVLTAGAALAEHVPYPIVRPTARREPDELSDRSGAGFLLLRLWFGWSPYSGYFAVCS